MTSAGSRNIAADQRTELPAHGGQTRAWNVILAAVGILIGLHILIAPRVVNHDAALHLDIGRLLLEGKRPYVDFVDTNPPMIMYLSAVPALISRLLHIHIIPAFHLFVIGLMTGSALACRRFMSKAGLGLTVNECNGAALSIFVLSFALMQTPDMDWGQREHLYLLLYLPFFYCRWIRWRGGRVSRLAAVPAGLFAAAGVCIKPHFVVAALLVEAFQLAAVRRPKRLLVPEVPAFILGGLLYAVHFAFLPAEIRTAFFERWAPLVVAGYSAYDQPWPVMAFRVGVGLALVGSVLGLALVWGLKDVRSSLARLFAVFGLVSLALYLMQHKGWLYHQIPAAFAGSMAVFTGALSWAHARTATGPATGPATRWPTLKLAAWIMTGVFLTTGSVLALKASEGFRAWPDPGMGELMDRYSSKGDPILLLSTQVGSIYPLLLQIDRISASRYITTFPIALIYASRPGGPGGDRLYHSRESMGPQEKRFLAELGADIAKVKPPVIMIDATEHPQALPPDFTFPGYFEATGFLDHEMAGYHYVETAFNWSIYIRNDSPRVVERKHLE